MTIARGIRQWMAAALALVTMTACAASVAGVAQSAPGASRSVAPPVAVSVSGTTGSTGESATSLGTVEADPTRELDPTSELDPTTAPITPSTTPGSAIPSPPSTVPSPVPSTSRTSGAAPPTTATGKGATARLAGSGAIVVSRGTPKITVDVFEEPYCPPCAIFAKQNRAQLDAAVAEGRIALRLRVVTFLDPKSPSGDYSTRAFSALLAVAGIDGDRPGVFLKFQNALFDPANQPKEGAAKDLTNTQIAAVATKVGVSRSAITAFGTDAVGTIAVQESAANQAALAKLTLNGVPAVAVNGTVVDHRQPDWLSRALGG